MAKKNYVYGGKAVAVMEWLNTEPSASDAHIAKHVGCHPTYVKQIRRKMIHAQKEVAQEVVDKEDISERLYQITRGRQARMADKVKETIEEWHNEPEIDEVLTERGNRYGSFIDHAEVTQQLKNVMMAHLIKKNKTLVVDQQEALEMIAHKIGRIVNGDPDYADSWIDIAGYAKLVADRLQGTVR